MNVIPDPTILVKTFDDPNWAVGFKPHGCEILTVIESLFLIFDIRLENAWKPAVVKSQPPMRIFPRILCVPKASAGGGTSYHVGEGGLLEDLLTPVLFIFVYIPTHAYVPHQNLKERNMKIIVCCCSIKVSSVQKVGAVREYIVPMHPYRGSIQSKGEIKV